MNAHASFICTFRDVPMCKITKVMIFLIQIVLWYFFYVQNLVTYTLKCNCKQQKELWFLFLTFNWRLKHLSPIQFKIENNKIFKEYDLKSVFSCGIAFFFFNLLFQLSGQSVSAATHFVCASSKSCANMSLPLFPNSCTNRCEMIT